MAALMLATTWIAASALAGGGAVAKNQGRISASDARRCWRITSQP